MMLSRCAYFVFLFCLLTLITLGNPKIQFEKISVENGLSCNTVLSIAQDHHGRIWFATYDGLTYFNGLTYQTIRHIPSAGKDRLPTGKPEEIKVDGAGNIWILFEGNRLIRLLNVSGECITYPIVGNNLNPTFNLELDKSGNLLLVSDDDCYQYNMLNDKFHPFNLDNDTSRSVLFNEIEKNLKQIVPDVKIHTFFRKKNSEDLWVTTTNHGIFKISNDDYAKAVNYHVNSPGTSAISSNEVYSLLVDDNGIVWAGTKDHGVNKGVQPGNYTFHTKKSGSNGLPSGAIRAIKKDNQGRLWVGSYSDGISILDGEQCTFLKFDHEQNDKWNWIRTIFQGVNGLIWVGSYGGLCSVDPVKLQITYYSNQEDVPSSLSRNRIYSIVEDSKQNLFIGEWGALDYYNQQTNTFTRIDTCSELRSQNIRKLMLASTGELWVGTESMGAFVLDTTNYKVIAHYETKPENASSLNSNSIFEIYEDPNGTVWIGSFGGLNSIDKTGRIKSYPTINKELPSTLIYQIFSDSKQKLWCSTIKGIVKIDTKRQRVRIYNQMDGANIHEFSEGAGFMDQGNKIFFGGVDGMISFHPDSILINPDVPNVLLESVTANGKIQHLNYPQKPSTSIHLASWDNDLSFQIQSILINNPYRNKIAWKLVPRDKTFQFHNGPKHTVNYPNLPSGKYTLIAKSANADGIWSEEEKVLSFQIDKPFWEELYFIFGLACFMFVTITLVIRFRFNQIKKQNIRLEQLVNQRTGKIEKQKIELQLANSILEKKNQKVQAQKDQILAQRDHLLEMYDKQEEMNRLKENFFTNISHDIRTPLALIYAPICELLKNPTIPAEEQSKLETIHSNTEYIIQLLDQILDRKKLETGGLEKELTHGDLVKTCQSVVHSFLDQAESNKINLEFVTNKPELLLRFDHGKLKQIVSNILANAIKFTQKGGTIKCELAIDDKQIEIEIKDTGIGIPKDRIKHIFERYYQVGKSLNENTRGSGIGLSMVKDFVQLFDGEVKVESTEGEGSSFIVTFPNLKSESLENTIPEISSESNLLRITNEAATEVSAQVNSFSETVLLVEDNKELQNYLNDYLSKYFHVVAVENGKKAYKYLQKNQAVNIVVSDWIMPEMDGIELCQAIRKKSRFQVLPFILLTALTDLNNEKEGYFAGIDEFMSKPFDPELLYLKISRLIKLNKQLEQKAKISEIIVPEKNPVETYDDKLLKKIMSTIEQELSNTEFDSTSLANKIGMSQMQLYRKLKDLVQMSPTEFIRSTRIKRATQLLENDSILINEISDMVGFNDPKYFSRCFSKETGMSPSKYRNQYLHKTTFAN